MPNIDPVAKRWESELAQRVGQAVATRRKAIGWTALQLADRTKAIGYPVSRVAISKIENNTRAGKLDVAELIALAVALDIPPALLLFPEYPQGPVEYRPGARSNSFRALRWFSGDGTTPAEVGPNGGREIMVANDGQALIASAEALNDLRRTKSTLIAEGHSEEAGALEEELVTKEHGLEAAKAKVWESGGAWWEAYDAWSAEEDWGSS